LIKGVDDDAILVNLYKNYNISMKYFYKV